MKRWFVALIAAGLTSAGVAMANDGKQLYEEYQCAHCHGNAEEIGKAANTQRRSAFTVDELRIKMARLADSKSHDEVMKGCGETLNHVQIREIASYLGSLKP